MTKLNHHEQAKKMPGYSKDQYNEMIEIKYKPKHRISRSGSQALLENHEKINDKLLEKMDLMIRGDKQITMEVVETILSVNKICGVITKVVNS